MEWIASDDVTREEVFPYPEGRRWYRPERFPVERRPRFIMPFVLWNPTETFILQEVVSAGLIDSRRSSPMMTNNRLIPVIALAEISRFGYCCFEVEFARMVREGKSERAGWLNLFQLLEYAARTGRFLGPSITETLSDLGLTPQDVGIGHGSLRGH